MLDGEVHLGGEADVLEADRVAKPRSVQREDSARTPIGGSVYFAGAINGTIRFDPGSRESPVDGNYTQGAPWADQRDGAVILGHEALRFGGERYGQFNESDGKVCEDHDGWVVVATEGQHGNCSAYVAFIVSEGNDCASEFGFGLAEDFEHCPASCGGCEGYNGPVFRTGYTLTLAVPEPTADLRLELPHETGRLLSTASVDSSLTSVGALVGLDVTGAATLGGALTVIGTGLTTDALRLQTTVRARPGRLSALSVP
jgi:hypothetical protein